MDNTYTIYIDSTHTTPDHLSKSDFQFEINEGLDLPDNTVCHIDDVSIPHTWYTIESYNNQFYIEGTAPDLTLIGTISSVPVGNYTASSLAAILDTLSQTHFPNDGTLYKSQTMCL